jgi:predicted membrane channel-forming protein YqfA (hemolysin III family)
MFIKKKQAWCYEPVLYAASVLTFVYVTMDCAEWGVGMWIAFFLGGVVGVGHRGGFKKVVRGLEGMIRRD